MTSARKLPLYALMLSLALLAACGGSGGGSGTASPVSSTTTPKTTVSGSVLAGPTSGSIVTVKTAAGTVVASSLPTGSDGSYSIDIPTSDLASELIFEASGGTFPDEATSSTGVALGTLSAHVAAGTLTSGATITIDPSSTIIQRLVAGGMARAAAETAFSTAFGYTPDCSVKPAFATMSSAATTTQRLAGLRAAAFSQLTKDLALTPDKQSELVKALADDLSDGVLDGKKSGVTVTTASGAVIPEDIINRFANALVGFQTSPLNRSKLTIDKIGAPTFAKTALTTSYKVEYIPGAAAAIQGKTSFQIKLTNRSNGTPAAGKTITLKPYMHMATKNHSTPVDPVITDNGDGTYSCTVYYLMASMSNGMSMGVWELKVMIDAETACFYPKVAMPAGITGLAKLSGIADSIAGPEKRTYFLFNDGLSAAAGGGYGFGLFLATKEDMNSFPAVMVGSQLKDQTGTAWAVTTLSVQVSTDGTTWVNASDSGNGHWLATGLTGLSTGVSGKIYVKLTVNSEQKTTDGSALSGTNGYQTFIVIP